MKGVAGHCDLRHGGRLHGTELLNMPKTKGKTCNRKVIWMPMCHKKLILAAWGFPYYWPSCEAN